MSGVKQKSYVLGVKKMTNMMMFLRRGSRVLPLVAGALLSLTSVSMANPLGLEQSPIDIVNPVFSVLPPLVFDYKTTSLHVINTGSPHEEATIRAVVPAGSSVVLSAVTYNLLQFHFHIEAEHYLNGHRPEMELHLVHSDAGGNLLVVGRWIELGAHNALLNEMFANLPPTIADFYDIASFNLAGLLPGNRGTYRYPGSLTTEPFTEGVKWNMFDEPLYMDQAQIHAFAALFPDENRRGVQALNTRVVLSDIPEPATFLLSGLGGLVLVVLRRRRRA